MIMYISFDFSKTQHLGALAPAVHPDFLIARLACHHLREVGARFQGLMHHISLKGMEGYDHCQGAWVQALIQT